MALSATCRSRPKSSTPHPRAPSIVLLRLTASGTPEKRSCNSNRFLIADRSRTVLPVPRQNLRPGKKVKQEQLGQMERGNRLRSESIVVQEPEHSIKGKDSMLSLRRRAGQLIQWCREAGSSHVHRAQVNNSTPASGPKSESGGVKAVLPWDGSPLTACKSIKTAVPLCRRGRRLRVFRTDLRRPRLEIHSIAK